MAIILLKIFFFKKFQKPYLDRKWGNDICSWQCSSDSDKPVKQYGRQTGIAKNLDTFWQKIFDWIFFVNLFVYMQKEFWFYLHWFSHNYPSKLLINLKENQKKGDNSGKKQFFEKKVFGISSDGHSDPKYVVVTILWSKLWRAVPEQTDWLTDREVKTEGPKIMFIESRLRLTLIIGGPINK